MHKTKYFFGITVITILLSSCGSSDQSAKLVPDTKSSEELKTEGNAINQTNPALMVIPSDALLKRLGCLKEIENQGTTSYERSLVARARNQGAQPASRHQHVHG